MSNKWNEFQSEHKGEGMTKQEMSEAYHEQQSTSTSESSSNSASSSSSTPESSSNLTDWQQYEHQRAGEGLSSTELSTGYQEQKKAAVDTGSTTQQSNEQSEGKSTQEEVPSATPLNTWQQYEQDHKGKTPQELSKGYQQQKEEEELSEKFGNLRMNNRQQKYRDEHQNVYDAPDHIIPVSMVKTAMKKGQYRNTVQKPYIDKLKDTLNSDWNFRMITTPTNQEWGQVVNNLNRYYRTNQENVVLTSAEQDYLLRAFDHHNNNHERFDPAVNQAMADYFQFYQNYIPYLGQATRHW